MIEAKGNSRRMPITSEKQRMTHLVFPVSCELCYANIFFFMIVLSLLFSCNSKIDHSKMNHGKKMDSIPDSTQMSSTEYLNNLEIPTGSQNVISSVTAIHPLKKKIQLNLAVEGIITYDTRQEKNISSRYSGRIEKLNIKYMYQPVRRGEILFEIYSPEMVTEQQRLIFLLNNDSTAELLIDASKKKLLLLGMTQEQVDKVIMTREPFYQLPVYSPDEGHIHEAYSSGTNTMNSDERTEANMDELKLKEGMYVQKGQILFNLLNSHMVYAMLKIYPGDAKRIKLHQVVSLTVEGLPGKTIQGEINFIEPVFSAGSKSYTARVYLDNMEHSLKVGMFVKAQITSDSIAGIWIPKAATVDLGTRTIVWLKEEKAFGPHGIKTGITSGDLIQVIDGLSESDEIASNAQYLADSESFISIK
jgi:Cu(I)/Ag(I) efflux system membrane fusion protein